MRVFTLMISVFLMVFSSLMINDCLSQSVDDIPLPVFSKSGNLYYSPDGIKSIQITHSGRDFYPVLSSDAKLIAFTSTWYGSFENYKSSTIICTKDGAVYGSGSNSGGQLCFGDHEDRLSLTLIPTPINKRFIYAALDIETTILLADDGTVFGCGYNQYGGLGLGDTKIAIN